MEIRGARSFRASVEAIGAQLVSVETQALSPVGSTRAIAVTLQFRDAAPYAVTASAIREDGEWRVCNLFA